jgi:hypothetical protein
MLLSQEVLSRTLNRRVLAHKKYAANPRIKRFSSFSATKTSLNFTLSTISGSDNNQLPCPVLAVYILMSIALFIRPLCRTQKASYPLTFSTKSNFLPFSCKVRSFPCRWCSYKSDCVSMGLFAERLVGGMADGSRVFSELGMRRCLPRVEHGSSN